jgi:hypothetical protein
MGWQQRNDATGRRKGACGAAGALTALRRGAALRHVVPDDDDNDDHHHDHDR